MFVGRDRELGALVEALESLSSGRGRLFLIAGEPGIGKTRLADEVAAIAAKKGLPVHWGSAWDGGGAPAFWPWTPIARALGAPEIFAPLAGRDPDEARFALFDRFVALLRERAPLCAVLDDIHDADRSSLELLAFVARELRAIPMLIVATYRDAEAKKQEALFGKLARVGTSINLAQLDKSAVAAIARGRIDDSELDALFDLTSGNPLYIGEMIELIRARTSRGSHGSRGFTVPSSVIGVIEKRAAMLLPESRAALDAAAVAGRDFSVSVLANALDERIDRMLTVLQEPVRAGLLIDDGSTRCRFSHPLIREAIYAQIEPVQKIRLHAAVASVLAKQFKAGVDIPITEVAHHHLAAVPEVPSATAIDWAKRAASFAERSLAFDRAVPLYERALAVLEEDAGARIDLMLALARARTASGERKKSQDTCLSAMELARRLDDPERFARAALEYGAELNIGVVDQVMVRSLEEALKMIGDRHAALEARVMARLAAALQPAPDPNVPVELARRAVEKARALGDRDTLVATLFFAGSAMSDYAPPRERIEVCEELVREAEANQDTRIMLRAYARLAIDALLLEDMELRARSIAAHERWSKQLVHPQHHWLPILLHAQTAMIEGRFDEMHALQARAQAIGERIEDPNALRTVVLQRMVGSAWSGSLEALLGNAEQATQVSSRLVTNTMNDLGRLFGYAFHEHPDAAKEIAEVLPRLPLPMLLNTYTAQAWLAQIAFCMQDAELAKRLLPRLEERSGLHVTSGLIACDYQGPFDRAIGMAYAASGDTPRAIAFLEKARASALRIRARPMAARIAYDLGVITKEQAHLQTAIEEAQAIGLEYLVRLARARLTSPAPAPSTGLVDSCTFDLVLSGEMYTVVLPDRRFHLKDSVGLRVIDKLIHDPGRELHVLELVSSEGAVDAGDAGAAIDHQARDAYRRRASELQAELREAESWEDRGRAEKLREELEQIGEELSRSLGLGGRDRKAGGAAERARVNVQKRVRDAVKRIAAEAPELGRHLEWAIQTGTFCSYRGTRRNVVP